MDVNSMNILEQCEYFNRHLDLSAYTALPIVERKRAIRRALGERLREIPTGSMYWEKSADQVFDQIQRRSFFRNARNILMYNSINRELCTHTWLDTFSNAFSNYRVFLPCVVGEDLELRLYEGKDSLVEVPPYGIREPLNSPLMDPKDVDVAIIPGVAFDAMGRRLGHGKGYYDRFLPKLRADAILVGVGYPVQLIDTVPVEEHDLTLDWIFTADRQIQVTDKMLLKKDGVVVT